MGYKGLKVIKKNIRAFLDVETTGVKSYSSHVIEVAAVVTDEDMNIMAEFETLANPGEEELVRASPEALEVNKISLDDVRRAPVSEDAARALRAFLERWPQAQYHAYNNDFDLWFLARHPWFLPARSWGECVMRATQAVMEEAGKLPHFPNGDPKWPSLQEAAQFFGIPRLQSHRALDDTRMAALVYREILRGRTELVVEDESRLLQEDGF